MKVEFTECPKCKNHYYISKKEKCIYCGYDKGFEDALEAWEILKDSVYLELKKIGKWLRNIFMEETK